EADFWSMDTLGWNGGGSDGCPYSKRSPGVRYCERLGCCERSVAVNGITNNKSGDVFPGGCPGRNTAALFNKLKHCPTAERQLGWRGYDLMVSANSSRWTRIVSLPLPPAWRRVAVAMLVGRALLLGGDRFWFTRVGGRLGPFRKVG